MIRIPSSHRRRVRMLSAGDEAEAVRKERNPCGVRAVGEVVRARASAVPRTRATIPARPPTGPAHAHRPRSPLHAGDARARPPSAGGAHGVGCGLGHGTPRSRDGAARAHDRSADSTCVGARTSQPAALSRDRAARYARPVSTAVDRVRARLDHPVIDADGHTIEYLPAVRDELATLAGGAAVAQLDAVLGFAQAARALSAEQRRALGLPRLSWWGLPTAHTLDRATAMLPRLQHARLDEIGVDYAVCYPTYGLFALAVREPEVRQAACRAFNRHLAAEFRDLGDRMTPAALVPMDTPDEAVAELEHAVGTLGLKAVVLAGHAWRPLPDAPPGARWVDTFGPDSPYDYDPVWARCRDLGVAPTFHSSSMSWHGRASLTSYVANHIGGFAAAGEATCRALFLAGVPHRFPELRFAFLEGGVAWACALFASLVGHWEKRNRDAIGAYDPARLDRALLASLVARHGSPAVTARAARLDEALTCLSEPDEDRTTLDEFAASGVSSPADLVALFAGRFYFGCEADDRLAAVALDPRWHPLGATLRPILGSDVGHWDVRDATEVLPEAWELVERGLMDAAGFRAWVFDDAVALWGPRFFAGTVVESAVRAARR
jgi:predicted TIM-barrel fold metal-dependent hydrolase